MILDPPNLDSSIITKAVSALIHHHEKTKSDTDLLASPEPLHVELVLQSIPKRRPAKPMQIIVPHSIHRKDEADICLFVKQSDVKELSNIYEGSLGIKKVMGLETLRKNYASFADRRSLMKTYSVFLADDRIVTMIPSVLGREVWNKPPLPVRVKSAAAIERAVYQSTYCTLSRGTTCTVRAGDCSHSVSDLVENVEAIVLTAWKKLSEQHSLKLQLVAVQLPTSVALPILNVLPTDLVQTTDRLLVKEEKAKKAKKRKNAKKSPLLEALKAQKDSTEEEEEGSSADRKRKQKEDDDDSSTCSEAKKQKNDGVVERKRKTDTSTSNDDSPVKKEKKSRKKEKEGKVASNEETESPTGSTTKKEPKTASTKKEKSATKTKSDERENEDDDPAKSAKKQKKTDTTADKEAEKKATFIGAKSFTGSKSGYVYKKGSKGLGYYLDQKPVVDKMVMDALLRMASRGSGGGGGRRNTGGGKRSKSNGRRRR